LIYLPNDIPSEIKVRKDNSEDKDAIMNSEASNYHVKSKMPDPSKKKRI